MLPPSTHLAPTGPGPISHRLMNRHSPAHNTTLTLLVGSYNQPDSAGLHAFMIDEGGNASCSPHALRIANPSFLATTSDATTLYCVNEINGPGEISALTLNPSDATSGFRVISTCPSHGAAPCHISVSDDTVFVANYLSGSISAYALKPDQSFGDLLGSYQNNGHGPHPRQESSHMHCIRRVPHTEWVYAADLGTDELLWFSMNDIAKRRGLNVAGRFSLAPGSGPRHFTWHPTLPVMYAVCELSCEVVVLDMNRSTGSLTTRAALSTLPRGTHHSSLAAAIALHPDGERLYVSNRGDDSIATYAINEHGDLRLLGHTWSGGRAPRDIAITPGGNSLIAANQESGTITHLGLSARDQLPHAATTIARVPAPTGLAFWGSHS